MATIMLVINLDAKIVLLLYGLIKSNFIVPLLNSSLTITPAVIMNITIKNISYSPNTFNIIPFALVLSHTVVPFSISYLFIAAVSFAS